MKIAPAPAGIACVVSRATHTALVAMAAEVNVSLAQLVAELLDGSVRRAGAARSGKAGAEVEAQQWQEAFERANDDVAALRRRLAEMELVENGLRGEIAHLTERAEGRLPPAPKPAPVRGHRNMIDRGCDEAPATDADPLTPAFVKSCIGFHWIGRRPEEIARLMCCPVAQVRRALEERR